MVSNLREEEAKTDIHLDTFHSEPVIMTRASYGFAIICLYMLGLIGSFAFLATQIQLKTAIGAFCAALLCCFCALVLLWRQDERQWGKRSVKQTRDAAVAAPWGREGSEAVHVPL